MTWQSDAATEIYEEFIMEDTGNSGAREQQIERIAEIIKQRHDAPFTKTMLPDPPERSGT